MRLSPVTEELRIRFHPDAREQLEKREANDIRLVKIGFEIVKIAKKNSLDR